MSGSTGQCVLFLVVPFIAELYLEMFGKVICYCAVGAVLGVVICMVVSFTMQYGLILVVSFITDRCGLLLAASFVVPCIGSVICYWAVCALSGSVNYYCAIWAVFGSVIFTECELCLTVSFFTVQYVLFWQCHVLLCNMRYVMQCQFLLSASYV